MAAASVHFDSVRVASIGRGPCASGLLQCHKPLFSKLHEKSISVGAYHIFFAYVLTFRGINTRRIISGGMLYDISVCNNAVTHYCIVVSCITSNMTLSSTRIDNVIDCVCVMCFFAENHRIQSAYDNHLVTKLLIVSRLK
jgi:hypothetical protein